MNIIKDKTYNLNQPGGDTTSFTLMSKLLVLVISLGTDLPMRKKEELQFCQREESDGFGTTSNRYLIILLRARPVLYKPRPLML